MLEVFLNALSFKRSVIDRANISVARHRTDSPKGLKSIRLIPNTPCSRFCCYSNILNRFGLIDFTVVSFVLTNQSPDRQRDIFAAACFHFKLFSTLSRILSTLTAFFYVHQPVLGSSNPSGFSEFLVLEVFKCSRF